MCLFIKKLRGYLIGMVFVLFLTDMRAFSNQDNFKIFTKEEVFSLVEAMPKTGRTHQIRIHLASIGHPIVGDALYGRKTNPFGLARQFLHAESVEFPVEEKRMIKVEAELSEELKNILKIFNNT